MIMFWYPFCSLFFCLSSNFSNHNYALCLWIIYKLFQYIYEVCSVEGISTNTYYSWLTEIECWCLIYSFICKSSRSWNNSNFSFLVNISRHNTYFALSWLNNSWAVRSNQSSFILWLHYWFDNDHVQGWDTLSDTDNEFNFCLDGLENGICSKRRWYINDWSFSLCIFFTFCDTSIYRKT